MGPDASKWRTAALGELIESAVDGPFGSNLKSSHYIDQAGVRVVRLQNIGRGEFEDDDLAWISEDHARFLHRHNVRAEDVLVASLGDENHPFGRACLYPPNHRPGIVKADCFRLRIAPRAGIPGFISRVLNCDLLRRALNGLAQGVTRDRVNLGNLLRFEILSPPLPEQQRIAEIFDTLDEAIRIAEQLIAKLKHVKQGLLHDLLTRGIDNNGELRDPDSHPEHFKESPLGRIPKGWRLAPLGTTAKVTVGYVGPTNPFYTNPNGGVLFLRTGNITEKGIALNDVRWVTKSFHASQPKSTLVVGDIVVSRVGYTGIAAVVPELGPVNCANMIIIRVLPGLRPHWVCRLFEAQPYMKQVSGFTAGSAQPVLNIKLVERLLTPLPPVTEQEYAITILASHEDRLLAEAEEVAKLRVLKQGLMEDLLTGRVRVTSMLSEDAA